jgi:Mg-chelatase subunit ChlD
MEELFRHSAMVIEPMLSITPEAFNAVEMVAPLGSASLFPDNDMRTSHRQSSVSLPVVGVVEASRPLAGKGKHSALQLAWESLRRRRKAELYPAELSLRGTAEIQLLLQSWRRISTKS